MSRKRNQIGTSSRMRQPQTNVAHGPIGRSPYPLSDAQYARRKQNEHFQAQKLYMIIEIERIEQEIVLKKLQEKKDALENNRKESN